MSTPFAGSFHKWVRHVQTTERPILGPANPAAEHPQSLIIPAESDIQEGAIRVSQPAPRPIAKEAYTDDGTYIPLSGGMRGWFENSGVPKQETLNGYRLHEAVDGDAFKKVILDRIETYNRRGAERFRVDMWVGHSDPDEAEVKMAHRAFCVDLSVTGAQLRTRYALESGQFIAVQFFRGREDVDSGDPLVTVLAEVTHVHAAGQNLSSSRYYVGVEFQDLEIATKEVLAQIVADAAPL